MSNDANTAAPSAASDTSIAAVTAADHAVVSGDVAAFREARRAEKSGTPVPTPKADSSPAQPDGVPASTPRADSSPADPEKRPDKRATEHRIPELLSERARLREENERLAKELADTRSRTPPTDATTADSSPATAPAIEYPADLSSFDAYAAAHPDGTYEDYLESRADVRSEFKAASKAAGDKAKTAQTEHATRVQQRDTAFRERIDAVKQADPAFIENLSEDVRRLKPFDAIRDAKGQWTEKPTGYHAITEEILSSEHAPALLQHFSDHPEDLHRIAALLPNVLLKEMGKLEATFGGTKGKDAAGTPPKFITDSPEPPTQVGRRPAEPDDPALAAVASGDVAAFRAARLRQRAAQHGGAR